MVLSDTCVAPGAMADATSPLPRTTSPTASSSFSMVKTRSRPITASFALDEWAIHPVLPPTGSSVPCGQTVPACESCRATGNPIFPRPRNAIFTCSLLFALIPARCVRAICAPTESPHIFACEGLMLDLRSESGRELRSNEMVRDGEESCSSRVDTPVLSKDIRR